MLQPSSATVTLGQPFSLVVQVGTESSPDPETGSTTFTPISSVPSVSVGATDTGTSYAASTGQITISGTPDIIPGTTWHWLNAEYSPLSGPKAPEAGTYSKITAVDSPATLPAITSYTYTVEGETFTLNVSMPSYNPVSTKLKTLLASVTN